MRNSEFKKIHEPLPSGRQVRTQESLLVALLIFTFALLCPAVALPSEVDPASEWHLLYLKIRDQFIPKKAARINLGSIEVLLKDFYLKHSAGKRDEGLCFPLKGYGLNAIGGRGGSGYRPKGYDFFDGNEHKGHPGHDIFIRDKDQNGLEDATGRGVIVLSASSGIVVSVNVDWDPSSLLRGGNYIWIYDPLESRYFYYAHLGQVFLKIGQIVSRGDQIGTVGRTGKNAHLRRSPTHLHFVVLQSIDGYPKPNNPYQELHRALGK
jgi:murein DD-endopeptidase MepM/ murein hydrolase activator NlpD